VWERLDATPPTVAVVLKPDRVPRRRPLRRALGVRAYDPHLI
jgi:hypothetical protein